MHVADPSECSEQALELLTKGLEIEKRGDYSKASSIYQKVLREEHECSIAYFYLGRLLLYLRDLKNAKKYLRNAVNLNPNLREAYILLATLYKDIGKKKHMDRWLKKAVNKFPQEDMLYLAAQIYHSSGYNKRALKILNSLMERNRKWEYLVLTGNVYLALGNNEKARDNLTRALKVQENPETLGAMANFLMLRGELQEAERLYRRAVEIDPESKVAWYNLGYFHHLSGKLSDAIYDYWKCIKIDPHDEIAWNNLGNALYNLHRYMESLPYFLKSVSINPNYAIGWNNIGNALSKMGIYRESLKFHNKALSIDAKFDYAYHARAFVKYNLEDYEGALEDIETALELNPDYEESYLLRGKILLSLERYEEAVDSLKIALEKEPSLYKAHEILGDIYNHLGYEVEALRNYMRGLELADENEKGRLLRKMGKLEEAIKYMTPEEKAEILYTLGRYQDVLELRNLESVKYWKCLSLEALGRYKEALEQLDGLNDDRAKREKKILRFILGQEEFDCKDVEMCLRIAAHLVKQKKFNWAIKILKKVKTPESYQIQGDIYRLQGNIHNARKYFEIAGGMGVEIAIDSLREVKYSEKISPEQKEN